MQPPRDLAAGWEALRAADWASARDHFAARLEESPGDAEALDGLGRALWWLGDREGGVARRREAYAEHKRAGNDRAAAGLATYLAAEHRISGEPAAAGGWLARARRLLEGQPSCAEHGWLEVELAKRSSGSPDEQSGHAGRALELARELVDADLEAAALGQLGQAEIDRGEVERGMALLDEAMAAATGGEASDPLAIGDTCCSTLVACERTADFSRSSEWCRTVVDFTGRHGYTPLHLWCRTIYAGVLTATGEWELAEEELTRSLRGYDELGSPGRIFAVARLAELRLRQGRLGEAERLLAGREDHPPAAPAAAGLALARDRPELACALAERALGADPDAPALAALLPVCLEARLANGDVDAAEATAARMRELGSQQGRENLAALALLGAARVAIAREEPDEARRLLDEAVGAFGRLRMPLEEGRARLALAGLEDDRELARVRARAALAQFERLGARHDADAAAALLRELGASGRSGARIEGDLTAREREVLDLLAEGLSNRAIADRLFISPKTAEHHVGRILGKLGLRSRAEAAAHALRGGGEAI